MRSRYEGKTWTRVRDPVGSIYEDVDLVKCTFTGCSLGNLARLPDQRTIVRRVCATDCIVDGGSVGPVLFEEVEIKNLRLPGGKWMLAPLFKHVVLKGKISTLSLTNRRWRGGGITWSDKLAQEEAAFEASALEFYKSVDWALDISEARFRELDWRLNLPARLVRRDPATQIVITRDQAIKGTWRKIPLHPTLGIALDMFVGSENQDTILAAARAASYYKDQLDGIRRLRDAGIAEPEPT
jgi:hypothetical protein